LPGNAGHPSAELGMRRRNKASVYGISYHGDGKTRHIFRPRSIGSGIRPLLRCVLRTAIKVQYP
jgi:hypothetical protein